MKVPQALRAAFDRWLKTGRSAQPASRWSPSSWGRQLPDHRPLFELLGDAPISREIATSWAAPVTDQATAVEAFLVSMIWGYGPVGYGPFRTARVLCASPDVAATLLQVAQCARDEGGVAAYEYIHNRRSEDPRFLKHLGPAFGTKYLYFVTKALTSEPTPVMDAVIRRWFAANAQTELHLTWADPSSYRQFVSLTYSWAAELSTSAEPVAADDVEYLIFADQAQSRRSTAEAGPQLAPLPEWTSLRLADEQAARILTQIASLEAGFAEAGWADEAHEFLQGLSSIVAGDGTRDEGSS